MHLLYGVVLCMSLLFSRWSNVVKAQETVQQAIWVVPDGSLSDLSQTFTAGTTLALSWNAWQLTAYIDPYDTLLDLWVTSFDGAQSSFNQLVSENINLTSPGTFAWTIAIPASNLTVDAKYVLRFKAASPTYNPDTPNLSSPGFLVLTNSAASSATSLSATGLPTTSSVTSSFLGTTTSLAFTVSSHEATAAPSTTTKSACNSCGLSTGAKAGIGVGVAISVLALAGGFFILVAKKKSKPPPPPEMDEMESRTMRGDHKYDIPSRPVELFGTLGRAELPERY